MEEHKPNSNRYKESLKQSDTSLTERKVEKVVQGTAQIKKKNGFGKLISSMMNEQVDDVKTYFLSEILLPAAKDLLSSVGHDFINLLFGKGRRSSGSSSGLSYWKPSKESDRSYIRRSTSSSVIDYDDISFDNRGDAEEIIFRMGEAVERYGYVTLSELYEMAGITCPHTYNNYGWTNVKNARVRRDRDGWIIDLPKPMPID